MATKKTDYTLGHVKSREDFFYWGDAWLMYDFLRNGGHTINMPSELMDFWHDERTMLVARARWKMPSWATDAYVRNWFATYILGWTKTRWEVDAEIQNGNRSEIELWDKAKIMVQKSADK